MTMISGPTLPGTSPIAVEGQEAEEAVWNGKHWFVFGGTTRIVGRNTVPSGCTAAITTPIPAFAQPAPSVT